MRPHSESRCAAVIQDAHDELGQRYHRESFEIYPVLRVVSEYVERTLPEPVTLRSAAKLAGREYKYFATYFRSKAGLTFGAWVNCMRLRRALPLFLDWNQSITAIACEAGFEDMGTFARVFKRLLGETPTSFRNRLRPESRQVLITPRMTPNR